MDAHEYLDGGTVRVAPETYAVCRLDPGATPPPTAFAVLRDETETTVVVDQDAGAPAAATEVARDWRRLTFEMELPFDLVGFLALVAGELADVGVSIFALSSYSTDHVLVKEDDLATATERLDDLGRVVV
ncbi:ACT domain-containing protein [Halobaculum marinum]|uniref:ACT domain-containing protein n=1 Tax=Halobaculum marinum TaxID=3031996 RepID=A0ABD5WTI1_9EURY|nr:ACT domain-containing protein [Halobaculum sp. DT55]